jgi:adenylate cyclase
MYWKGASGDRTSKSASTQLIDAETDAHLWAERFDRDMGDLLALQSDITRRIAIALSSELVIAETARPIEHSDALDYILCGRAASNKGVTPDNLTEAVDLFEHALALDPRSGEAQGLLASTLTGRVLAGMTNSHAADIGRAEAPVEQALAASPRNTIAHYAKGQLLRAEGRCEEAIPEFEAVVASNRNSAGAFFALGVCKIQTGVYRGSDPAGGAGYPSQSLRSGRLQSVSCDWPSSFAAIAHRRGNRLA